jgi:hypothetical protein
MAAGLAGICLCAGTALAQPTINSVYPDGAYLMQPTAALTFTANSTAGVNTTDISVQLTATTLGGTVVAKNYTTANGLVATGSANSWAVSVPLKANRLYSGTITVKDINGATTTTALSGFSTIAGYTFEAEDYDYTTGTTAGQYIAVPQTNQYANLQATLGTDINHDQTSGPGNNAYRPRPTGLAIETTGDTPREQYAGGGQDYDVGWNNGGDWANYTRKYPAGTYNVYLRGSDGNGPQSDAASMTVQAGTAALAASASGNSPFTFNVPGGGWQTFHWCPLLDSAGNPATLTCDGTASTLQLHVDGGNLNMNFVLLVPVEVAGVSVDSITNVYPDGSELYQPTNTFAFTVTTTATAVDPTSVSVLLTGTNVWGQGAVTLLQTGSGLTASGSGTSVSFTAALAANTIYKALVTATDANGNSATTNVAFNTITPYYSFEAEDYDYEAGQFIDNPQTNLYANLSGLEGFDTHDSDFLDGFWTYRNQVYGSGGLENEACNDKPRPQYAGGLQDYDLGFAVSGNWANYTRTYPTGMFNIYLRAANGNSAQADSASMWLVTEGLGTTNQTEVDLGTFAVPNTGGWQTYAFVPLVDAKGNLVQFSGGAVKTLRARTDSGSYNANFYLLMPANPAVKPLPTVGGFQPDGTALFQSTNVFTFLAQSSPGLAANNISVSLNGVPVPASKLTFLGSANLWTVSTPVWANAYYTAVITATDANGTTVVTNTFGTFNAADYQFEAEDYDYSGGQYYDTGVDQYAGKAGVLSVDSLENDPNALSRGYTYRPEVAQDFPDTTSGDQARSQFTAVSGTDYSIGSFGSGSFANYTRHYPAGTYNVMGRFAEGAAASKATLGVVTNGYTTTTQAVQPYGTFYVPSAGWGTWEWAPLVDSQGNQVKVTLSGSLTTLQLGGSPAPTDPEVNVNFFMLVPTFANVWLTPKVSGGSVNVSFNSTTGYSYQLQSTTSLNGGTWTNVGAAVNGNNLSQSVADTEGGTERFYRVQVQQLSQ